MLVSMQAAARGISGRFGLQVLGGVRRWGCGSWDSEVEGLWVRFQGLGFVGSRVIHTGQQSKRNLDSHSQPQTLNPKP